MELTLLHSVIKRQHALMHPADPETTQPLSRAAAYDKARRELYNRRAFDEMESRIAKEEALAVGAEFGASAQDVGMYLENCEFDRWRTWANEQVTLQEQARAASYASLGQDGPDSERTVGLADSVEALKDDVPLEEQGAGASE